MPKTRKFRALICGAALSAMTFPVFAQENVDVALESLELILPHEETIIGNAYAARCDADSDQPAINLRVHKFKDRKGNIRAQLYNDKPEDFLEKGKKLLRIELKVPEGDAPVEICVPLQEPGVYALFLLHDRNENGKANVFSEGFGISNNPKMKLRRPRHDEAAFEIGNEVLDMDVDLQYFGSNKRRRKR